ncbi:MAG: OmpA family protein [Candidatus Omnitrophica bacterium]|nr:OmpA family protein [Candidatus Omnitrophota bacterium]
MKRIVFFIFFIYLVVICSGCVTTDESKKVKTLQKQISSLEMRLEQGKKNNADEVSRLLAQKEREEYQALLERNYELRRLLDVRNKHIDLLLAEQKKDDAMRKVLAVNGDIDELLNVHSMELEKIKEESDAAAKRLIKKKEREIKKKNRTLREKERIITATEGELSKVSEMSRLLAKKNKQIKEKGTEVESLKTKESELSKIIEQKTSETEQLLKEKDEQIEKIKKEKEAAVASLETRERELNELCEKKDSEISRVLAKKDEEIEDLRKAKEKVTAALKKKRKRQGYKEEAKESAGMLPKQQYNELAADLNKELAGSQANLAITDRGLTFTLLTESFFNSGQADIRQGAKPTLEKIAHILKTQLFQFPVIIEGHTDNIPVKQSGQRTRWKSNWELSVARALAVVYYFVHEAGIEPERLSVVGYGEYKPIASNNTPEGRAKNRRVEIVAHKGTATG